MLLAEVASTDLTGGDPLWFVGLLDMLFLLARAVAVSLPMLAGRGGSAA